MNAYIVMHKELSNFRLIDNIYNLPFSDRQFKTVLCSHTLEHVVDPVKFYGELRRVGTKVKREKRDIL